MVTNLEEKTKKHERRVPGNCEAIARHSNKEGA